MKLIFNILTFHWAWIANSNSAPPGGEDPTDLKHSNQNIVDKLIQDLNRTNHRDVILGHMVLKGLRKVVNLQLAHSMSMKTKLDELENIMDELTATSSKALNLLQRPNSSVIHKSYSTGTGFAHSMSLKTKFDKMDNLMDELTETSSKALNLVQKRNSSVNSSDK